MPDDETVGMSNPSVPLPTVPLIEAADRPVRWMTTPDDDTETLAEVREAHAAQSYEFETDQTYCPSSGVPTDACHTCMVLARLDRIVQARAGEAEVTNAEYDALRDAVGRDRDLDAVFSRVVDAVGVILSARAGEGALREAVRSLIDANFVPDFAGVDWNGGDRTVQRFVADLLALTTADPT